MDKIRVALIGVGGMGFGHLGAYKKIEEAELVAVCDVRADVAKSKLGEWALPVYTDLDELLEQEQIDMVDIVTPSYLHAEMVIKCLQRGLHVLCEKPMTLTVAECEKILSIAKQSNKLFMVAHVVRFMSAYKFLANEIAKGEHGKLLRLDMKRISGTPTWSWEDWMRDESKSGGVGVDLSIHDIDFVQSVLGTPKAVQGVYSPLKNNSSYIVSTLVYDETTVTCEGTWYNANIPFMAEYLAVFEKGYVQYRNDRVVKNGQGVELDMSKLGDDLGINISGDGAYGNEIRYFLSCIQKGVEPSFVTPASSAESIRLVREIMEKAIIV